jgi:hypothetical protein
MTSPKIIDIDDEPGILGFVISIREGHETVRLQRAGEDLAVVTPVFKSAMEPAPRRIQTAEELAEFLSLAAGWANTDTDALVEHLHWQCLE